MRFFYSKLITRLVPHWSDAITEGAKRHGINECAEYTNQKIEKNDVLFILNRHMFQDKLALEFEKQGNKVIVIESPYIRQTEPWLSIGIGYHNNIEYSLPCLDSGERFKSFNKQIKPWRKNNGPILFCTQSKVYNNHGIGWRNYAQPEGMDSKMIRDIRQLSNKEIVYRMNPKSIDDIPFKINLGNKVILSNCAKNGTIKPIEDDLMNAYCTVLWTSNSATDSLLEGVPVVVVGPGVFLKDACNIGLHSINNLKTFDGRQELFNRMAWNQFSQKEIKQGFMWDTILHNIG